MDGRRNETPKLWFRSERIFRSNGQWYFHTREGIDVGPFATRFAAEVEASILKNILKDEPEIQGARARIRQFMLDSEMAGQDLTSFTDYVVSEGHF
jgi:hypothetical protein